jgi:hypothetical protein
MGQRFIVRADEKLTAFVELERAVCIHLLSEQYCPIIAATAAKRFVVHADELTAFLELEAAIRPFLLAIASEKGARPVSQTMQAIC